MITHLWRARLMQRNLIMAAICALLLPLAACGDESIYGSGGGAVAGGAAAGGGAESVGTGTAIAAHGVAQQQPMMQDPDAHTETWDEYVTAYSETAARQKCETLMRRYQNAGNIIRIAEVLKKNTTSSQWVCRYESETDQSLDDRRK